MHAIDDYQKIQHEYSEIAIGLRHYSSLRFAILTVFFALIGGLATIYFGEIKSISQGNQFVLVATQIGGLVVTYVFYVFERRLIGYMNYFAGRLKEMEVELGYRGYGHRPMVRNILLHTHTATQVIYISTAIFWMIALVIGLN